MAIETQTAKDSLAEIHNLHLCSCWTLEPTNGVSPFYFTDHDCLLQVRIGADDQTFSPLHGIRSSAKQARGSNEGANLDLEGPCRSDGVTFASLCAGFWRNGKVREHLVNWQCPWKGPVMRTTYYINELTFTKESWKFALDSVERRLEQPIGLLITRNCRHDLGDSRCTYGYGGFPVGTYETGRAIVSIVTGSRGMQFVFNSAKPNNYYDFGLITWTSGANSGTTSEVKTAADVSGTYRITLATRPAFPLTVGDQFTIRVGCDKTLTTCLSKFANTINFGGFPVIPGFDRVSQTPLRTGNALGKKE